MSIAKSTAMSGGMSDGMSDGMSIAMSTITIIITITITAIQCTIWGNSNIWGNLEDTTVFEIRGIPRGMSINAIIPPRNSDIPHMFPQHDSITLHGLFHVAGSQF
ncbi:hypothetical protein [Bhargavaea cecembensis]|nr:hypothetical protein [Bhargavaea cecembensis]